MEKLKKFESFKDTMVGGIFTSDFDEEIKSIFNEIKDNYDSKNLFGSPFKDEGFIGYKLDDRTVEVRDDMFFGIPGYKIKINEINVDCSYLLNKKIYKYLNNKWKENEKSETSFNISKLGSSSHKYNL